ncbi:MAG: GTP-binding protein [Thermomicrobiales bacterium]
MVSNVAGTTRDTIDSTVDRAGLKLRLIDTAGIRRRGSIEPGIERYSVVRSMRAIDRADVAVALIDAVEGFTSQDAHIAGYVAERGKGIVIAINKWMPSRKIPTRSTSFSARRQKHFHSFHTLPCSSSPPRRDSAQKTYLRLPCSSPTSVCGAYQPPN